MRKILVVNDDGITSEGLVRLARLAKKYGEVWVIAPSRQFSAKSHSATFWEPIEIWPVDFPVEDVHAYAISGTPSDCSCLGINEVIPGGPDRVFCGINLGYNIASDIQYSATVGAALEASFQGYPAIADELIDKPLGKNEIWNVNFPGCSLEECRGIKYGCIVSQDDFYAGGYNEIARDGDKISYQIDFSRNWQGKEGTDLGAIVGNYISVGKV